MRFIFTAIVFALAAPFIIFAQDVPSGRADAVIDLSTEEGVHSVLGNWKYSDTRIVETEFLSAGVDGQPTGDRVRTYDYEPKAGTADFDDSGWQTIPASGLATRRGNGRLSFNWYRIRITVPERIGGYSTAGSTIVFQATLDDYAEIWVDGEIARYLGQKGGSVVGGWNSPNRLVIGRDVRPGQQISIAVFGINGPISNPPTNFIWVREARLEFYRDGSSGPYAVTPSEVNVEVDVKDPAMARIVGPNPKVWKLAEGFKFTEGPVWTADGLLFSDPNSNVIYRYSRDGELKVYRTPSGYAGKDIAEYGQPGSNGLALDGEGRLVVDQHGNRRVIRLENDGSETVLADSFEGKRLNSPNDLVYRSDGTLFFTDPPFGLPKFGDDPRKELPFSGVYSLKDGQLRLLTKEFTGPNGIALSPDEKYLYVGNWDEKKKTVYRYDLIFEATGYSPIVFEAMQALAKNGVLVLSSVTGGDRTAEVPADKINLEFVLGNKVMVGTVNANREYFEAGVRDLSQAVLEYPGWLERLLTHPVMGLGNYEQLFAELTGGTNVIKVFCEVQEA